LVSEESSCEQGIPAMKERNLKLMF
jgi:hypothetical protein